MNRAEIAQNRRTNVLHIIHAQFAGNKTRFARVLSDNVGREIAATIVHRWFWDNAARRNIGESHARLIEQAFNLKYASLDTPITASLSTTVQEQGGDYHNVLTAPLVDWQLCPAIADAGSTQVIDKPLDQIINPTTIEPAYYLSVKGDSMQGQGNTQFTEGMLILISPVAAVEHADFVVASLADNTIVFRQYLTDESDTPYLKPLNPEFPTLFGSFRVLGKVVFSGTFFV